ncbi:class I SAM-dependent methyltransferase [Lysobacter sp. KIS68-7]|uniref:class I SAM-dependent methyltransferase n=1 Tax=Lysobacter sp. KIS68-7 TaxID=2904252 RepID=UPI001E65A949|nr:class I SAM-dependent methyltransferase [Lysobacter sp. KIS68-7]UHQ19940.1 class I SAM-dependent methyltransferase [Lysobacter sp. KIS68-7]
MAVERIAWSCVLDDVPSIWSSFTPWLATALGPGGIEARDIVVHHAAPLRADIEAMCRARGVRTVAVAKFDPRSPHCNKIRQVETDFGDAQCVVLMDCDMAFAAPLPIARIAAPVAGKLVDAANPPLPVLRNVFAAAALPLPEVRTNARRDPNGVLVPFDTLAGNFNGGLYIVDARALRDSLGPRWAHWARWLLERLDLLERWRVHVDQVAFCLALAESGLHAELLSDVWNFPTHMRVTPTAEAPLLLHHHGHLDPHMRLDARAAPEAAASIARANAAIDAFQREGFDNRTFWNHRYAAHPALGSGLGSRGDVLERKHALLAALAELAPEASLLDWGCGDLEVSRTLRFTDGTGVDIATEALRVARGKRPDWRFMTPAEFDADDRQARDFVFCLDVLIHQRSREDYAQLLQRLAPLARTGLLVAGYDANPHVSSHITYFHEPLHATLASLPEVLESVPLMEYRDTTLYFAATSEAGRALAHRLRESTVA